MNDIEEFGKLIKDIKFTMLTTVDPADGSLFSRPMTLQETEFDGDLWFFAKHSSDLVKQIRNKPLVNLAFSNPKDFSFVSATGYAQVVDDRMKAEELWKPMLKAWFAKGLEDPELCLIQVTVESAEYWRSPESKMVRLTGFAKALLTGEQGQRVAGKQGHISIS